MEEKKTLNRQLTDIQENFCKLVAQGSEPLDAMLEVYPTRKGYSKGNQNQLLKSLMNNPRVVARLKELYNEIRNNAVLGDMYNFDKGVKLLTDNIDRANKRVEDGEPFTESIHRIILTSVQELNRMYGFNIVDRNGNTGGTMNVTFVKVDNTEGDVKIGGQ
ncbi:MAG: hypothetical protein ACI3T9_00965 [Romboutsia timonensis]